jgi:hypothetical protein
MCFTSRVRCNEAVFLRLARNFGRNKKLQLQSYS